MGRIVFASFLFLACFCNLAVAIDITAIDQEIDLRDSVEKKVYAALGGKRSYDSLPVFVLRDTGYLNLSRLKARDSCFTAPATGQLRKL